MANIGGTMANIFAGNPMTSVVGHKIEQATDPSLASEDWTLNMEICDIINASEETAKDAARAIRKRLHVLSGKNYTSVMYTLTVLETCVKNCGHPFHVLICQKDFVQDLIKLIGPKVDFSSPPVAESHLLSSVNSTIMSFAETIENAMLGPRHDPPLVVQEKTLALVQSWAHAFRGRQELSGAVAVYDELVAKGVQFPDDGDTPILTPHRSTPAPAAPARPTAAPAAAPTAATAAAPTAAAAAAAPAPGVPPPAGPISLTPQQAEKLKKEIHVVDGNLQVFNEMLSALKPSSAPAEDGELLKHLAATCGAMQSRLVSLVGRVSQDQLTAELLRLNDELNNAFIRYERFERSRSGGASPEGRVPASAATSAPPSSAGALIDLGDDTADTMSRQLAGLAVGTAGVSQHLPRVPATSAGAPTVSAATSRPSGAAGAAVTGAAAADSVEPVLRLHQEQDFDEMEQWLKEGDGSTGAGRESSDTADGTLTNTEFDRFLAERAAASEPPPAPARQ